MYKTCTVHYIRTKSKKNIVEQRRHASSSFSGPEFVFIKESQTNSANSDAFITTYIESLNQPRIHMLQYYAGTSGWYSVLYKLMLTVSL